MRKLNQVMWLGVVGVAGTACDLLPPLPGSEPNNPPLVTTTTSTGFVRNNGVPLDYRVDAAQSSLLLMVRKVNAQSCGLFHDHAMAALATNYTFALDRQAPGTSTLKADVVANGLDADSASAREQFDETRGSSFTERERADIRSNMLAQLEASSHPMLTFEASALSTLEGAGTASVSVNIRGVQSTTTLNATATWAGDVLTIDGTGALNGGAHGLPRGSFSDCVDPNMTLKMHLVLAPGANTGSGVDASVPPFVQTTFPDELPCGPVGYDDVADVIALNCGGCHSDPAQYSATEPLRSWANFHVNSNLFRDDPLFNDAWDRMLATDGRRMPPEPYALTSVEYDAIVGWLSTGAHQHRCDASGNPITTAPDAGATCKSNSRYVWDDPDDSPLPDERMFPGKDCLDCHARDARDAEVNLGGTVFRGIREADRCYGWSDSLLFNRLTVELVGADGTTHRLPVNASGNFLMEGEEDVVAPYHAAVLLDLGDGGVLRRDMVGAQTEKSCNRCHTVEGTLPYGTQGGPAVGRIVAPGVF